MVKSSTRARTENSIGSNMIPALVIGEHITVLDARPRLGHHIGHGIAPLFIMCRLLVSGRVVRRSVDLDQNKAGGVVLLLDDVESGDARLLNAVACVFKLGCLERSDLVGLDMNENMNYQHNSLLTDCGVGSTTPRLLYP